MTRPTKNKKLNLLDAFNNLFANIDPDTAEETDEIIRSAGIDPNAYAAKIEKIANNALVKQARHQIETVRQRYDDKKTPQVGNRQTIIQRIQEMLSELSYQERMVFAHYRNLESASDADLQSLLDDLSFLMSAENRGQEK